MEAVFDARLRNRAVERPDAVAVVDSTTGLTYSELDRRVAELARRIAHAVESVPARRVALIADNSVGHLIAAFAVWRAGATLVTVYPSSTADEFEYALGHSEPSLVIAGREVIDTVGVASDRLGLTLTELRRDGTVGDLVGGIADGPDDQPRTSVLEPDGLALICYTSGSTSRPKAVMHSHAGLLAAATSYARVWHLGEADVTLVSLPLAWAFGLVTTSMATLSAGGRVVLLARSDPAALLANLVDHEVTFFAGVTTVFVKLVEAMAGDATIRRPASLRLCISGGEPRNDAAFARWEQLTGCPVHDVYAASECFPVVTYDPIADPRPMPGSAGRVVPDAAMRLVTADGVDVADGTAGEAWTRGPALMLGYWHDPALTSSVLTPDGWYRTGDLVEIDAAGYVRVVGRLSDLIIRGGANVSPAEVEAVLTRHPSVREATVVGVGDPRYGEEVVAAIVLEPGVDTIDLDEITAHCTRSLAGYKRPTRYVVVAQLPRNANTGKVQRRELAAQLAVHLASP
jgi:long-chain acyl-CoA synthetase